MKQVFNLIPAMVLLIANAAEANNTFEINGATTITRQVGRNSVAVPVIKITTPQAICKAEIAQAMTVSYNAEGCSTPRTGRLANLMTNEVQVGYQDIASPGSNCAAGESPSRIHQNVALNSASRNQRCVTNAFTIKNAHVTRNWAVTGFEVEGYGSFNPRSSAETLTPAPAPVVASGQPSAGYPLQHVTISPPPAVVAVISEHAPPQAEPPQIMMTCESKAQDSRNLPMYKHEVVSRDGKFFLTSYKNLRYSGLTPAPTEDRMYGKLSKVKDVEMELFKVKNGGTACPYALKEKTLVNLQTTYLCLKDIKFGMHPAGVAVNVQGQYLVGSEKDATCSITDTMAQAFASRMKTDNCSSRQTGFVTHSAGSQCEPGARVEQIADGEERDVRGNRNDPWYRRVANSFRENNRKISESMAQDQNQSAFPSSANETTSMYESFNRGGGTAR